jgi:hypothetical protein
MTEFAANPEIEIFRNGFLNSSNRCRLPVTGFEKKAGAAL